MLREYAGGLVVGRCLCVMGLACALAGILLEGSFLEGVWAEIPGIALGAAGYGIATRASDRAGQVLGVGVVVVCAVSVAIPSFDLPGLFLEA